jgi:hypothetical protein
VTVSPAEILFDPDSAPKIFPGATGEFQFKAAPGYYMITARMQIAGRQYSSGRVQVAVTDRNVDNLLVPLLPSVTLSGRVTVEGARIISDTTGAVVSLMNIDGNGETTKRALIASRDGMFNLLDVAPDDYELLASLPGYYAKTIAYGARDAVLAPLRIEANSNARVEIVLSVAGASATGNVLDSSGNPAAGAQIILIPEERFRKRQDRYLFSSTDKAGHFEVAAIPPGAYTAFAFEEIEPGAWYDPDFNRRFSGSGMPFRAEASTRATLELKMISEADGRGGR